MSVFFILFILFLIFYCVERRSVFISLAWVITCSIGLVWIVDSPVFQNATILRIILLLLFMAVAFVMILGPFIFIGALYYNGFQILRREGVRLTNFLSLGLALAITFYVFVVPSITQRLSSISLFNFIFFYIGLLILYLLTMSILYTTSSIFNIINIFPRKRDYIIVLGAGLIGDRVTPLLASRIQKGIKIYHKNPGSKLIMSGGQGPDEIIPEAQAMANYALEQGVDEADIIIENRSTNTEENLRFSNDLVEKGSKLAIVTNYYHVFRALLLARKLKIKCIGYGAKTKFYFSLNAFIREFVGYLVMTKRQHVIILSLLTIVYILLIIVSFWLSQNQFQGI